MNVILGSARWVLIHWDGRSMLSNPTIRSVHPTRKAGLKVRCTNGHTTKCCTVQPEGTVAGK